MFQKNEPQAPDLEFFVIYDSKSSTYSPPIQALNRHVLIRDIVNDFKEADKKNAHYTNAEDFSLFITGSYSKKTGLLRTQNIELVANLHELRSMAQQDANPRALTST